jgi:hypothetical protein
MSVCLDAKCGRGVQLTKSAVLVVSNIKARMEVQHSILTLSLHDLLQEIFTFTTCRIYELNYHLTY